MKLADLKFDYPSDLIATFPSRPSRVMWVDENKNPTEKTIAEVLQAVKPGDVFVINNTKVLKRRVFSQDEIEILFLDQISSDENSNTWKVLFPSKNLKLGEKLNLPEGYQMTLLEKGRPQVVSVTPTLDEAFFERQAELPLPPYIQKARALRHNHNEDEKWYQTAWAEKPGSQAAPTASLHFSAEDIHSLKNKGVQVVELTLHVGLGTFLPVTVDDLDQHKMHSENYEISKSDWQLILEAKKKNQCVWALGTTCTRVLESVARTEIFKGSTDILLQVGTEFKIVDRLMTNFHQPESTLLALVAGFAGLPEVHQCYRWAIERKFKLFSYGDFSVWCK